MTSIGKKKMIIVKKKKTVVEESDNEGEYDCGCYYKIYSIADQTKWACDAHGIVGIDGKPIGSVIMLKGEDEVYVCINCEDEWRENGWDALHDWMEARL
tara:strand:- start:2591 stop:2887 length:297 start_codon:yes stop_codon:yes gene_type:complete